MFLRTVKAAGGKGVQHEYVRLVEAYREDGTTKQRVVCNLGRKDLLAAHLDALIRLLRGEPAPAGRVAAAAGAGDRRLGLGPDVGGAHAVARAGAGHAAHRAGRAQSRRRPRAGRAGAGAGGQSPVRSDERARPGAVVGDGLRVRSAGAALGAGLAGRRRTPGQSLAAGARGLSPAQAVVPHAGPVARAAGQRSNRRCTCACAISSRCRSTWCSTT